MLPSEFQSNFRVKQLFEMNFSNKPHGLECAFEWLCNNFLLVFVLEKIALKKI